MNDIPVAAPVAQSRLIRHDELLGMLRETLARTPGGTVAVLMVELRRANRLQAITSGPSSEVLLDHALQRLDRVLRDADRMARLSSEQICVVLPGLGDSAQSVLAAVRILATLQKPFGIGDQTVIMRPHIGIAIHPEAGREADQLMLKADIAARIAASSETGYHMYRTEDRVETEIYRGLDVELARAIKSNSLQLHYQPQIEAKSGRCESVEALLRWEPPGGRDIAPGILVGLAESTGLLGALTTWILNTVLRESAELRRAGILVNVSMNLSPRSLIDVEFPDEVAQALAIWGVPAESLAFEITEGSMIGDEERSLKLLNRLRDMGIRLAIDDFGTGYSSLAYLKRFPVNELKIDKMFVQAMRHSRGDLQIVRSVIDLAHNFELRAVAEGVEDVETLDLLTAYGCDAVQGFLFSRALPRQDFATWFKARLEHR